MSRKNDDNLPDYKFKWNEFQDFTFCLGRIIQYAEKKDAEFAVMTTSGRTGL